MSDLRSVLEAADQAHLIAHLTPALEAELRAFDAADWARFRAALSPQTGAEARLAPIDAVPAHPADEAALRAAGEAAIRAGTVAAFVVAGGQGTRLGYDGPKGEVPATPITQTPLFGVFAAQLKAVRQRYGVAVPWYVMCSPLNAARTQAFFNENKYFGLNPADVFFVVQGVHPTFDEAGRARLAGPGALLCNPDGHGGSLTALQRSGALADMQRRGVAHLAYFQVDNPLTRIIDPVFIGLHLDAQRSSGQFSSKMVAKTEPSERVGVFGRINDGFGVIEYSDLSTERAAARRPDGRLLFDAGNVAVHMLSTRFIAALTANGRARLPLHTARKRSRHWDPATQQAVEIDAIKLEQFVFDALAQTERPLVWTVERCEAFAPIKNATGVDSAESSLHLQIERAARWLTAAGVEVPRRGDGAVDCVIEIRPETALAAEELDRAALPDRLERGKRYVF